MLGSRSCNSEVGLFQALFSYNKTSWFQFQASSCVIMLHVINMASHASNTCSILIRPAILCIYTFRIGSYFRANISSPHTPRHGIVGPQQSFCKYELCSPNINNFYFITIPIKIYIYIVPRNYTGSL